MLSDQVHQVSRKKTEGRENCARRENCASGGTGGQGRVSRLSGDLPSCPHTTGHFASAAGSLTSGLAGAGERQRGQAGCADSGFSSEPEEWEHTMPMADAAGRDLLGCRTSAPTSTFKKTSSVHGLIF